MDILIGQQLADGVIRYIAVSYYNNYNLVNILRNFYTKESRVTALIELGNLVTLRPTPYGKSNGYDDKIHCRAEIRDDKEKKGKHLPKYADNEAEYLKLKGYLFLFKDNRWYHKNGDVLSCELPDSLSTNKSKAMDGLELFSLDEKGEIAHSYGNDITSWDMLRAKAAEKNVPYFIFRKNKLVATINHPLNRL